MSRQKTSIWRQLKKGDWLLLALLLATVILTASPLLAPRTVGGMAVVHLPGNHAERLSLLKEGTYTFDGVRGKAIIGVHEGEVYFVDSDCPNKLCIQMGRIKHTGQIIICIPNQVWVTVEDAPDSDPVDGITW